MAEMKGRAHGIDGAVGAIEARVVAKTMGFATAVGAKTVAYLRSLTGEVRPPARAGKGAARSRAAKGGPRQAHPGHWADDTSILAASYGFEVTPSSRGVFLTLKNTASYAKWLEDRNGYWVLSGVVERGGPVDKVIAELSEQFGFRVGRIL